MTENNTFHNTLHQTFNMKQPDYLVLAIVGKPHMGKTERANKFILDCVSNGGKVVLSSLKDSKLNETENLIISYTTNKLFQIFDIVESAMDDGFSPTLLVIDDLTNPTKSDVMDLKRFAYGYKLDIIVTTSPTDQSENFDGYIGVESSSMP